MSKKPQYSTTKNRQGEWVVVDQNGKLIASGFFDQEEAEDWIKGNK